LSEAAVGTELAGLRRATTKGVEKLSKKRKRLKWINRKEIRPSIPVVITDEMAKNMACHDMSVDEESLFKSLNFINRCGDQAQQDPTSEATFYIEELTRTLASLYANLVTEGNIKLAGLLPTILETFKRADSRYRNTVRIMPKQNTLHNRFVAYLYQGCLWNEGRFTSCQLTAKKLPPKEDKKAWKMLIMRYLRRTFRNSLTYYKPKTKRRRCKIDVFEYLLKSQHARKFSAENEKVRLIDGPPSEQWKAVEDAIEHAIETMHKR